MAPLPHLLSLNKLLLLSLFAFTLLSSFFFVFSTSHSHSLHSHVFLGRRNLLANKNIVDNDNDNDNGDDFLGEIVPRKKKSSLSDAPIKKKSPPPEKKKKSLSNDESQLVTPVKKKKSSFSFDDDDKEVEKSKKKKSSNSENAEKLAENKKKSLSSSLSSSISSKNQTKITKAKPSTSGSGWSWSSSSSSSSTSSIKDEIKLTKPTLSSSSSTSSKNKIKPTSKSVDNSSSSNSNSKTPTITTKLKLNKLNSTKPIIKKPLDLLKSNSAAKNKTKSPSSTTPDKSVDKTMKQKSQNQDQKQKNPSWTYQDNNDEDEDLVSEFRDLPIQFHQSFIPDLHRISTTSKVYLTQYNKEFTTGFKPYVGNKYAPSLATAISCIFIIVPFLLVSLVFNRIKAYFSLQKLILFIQIYLSIYFSILCLSSLITGLEPLRFFYATSQSTYIWLQVLQTLAYVLYLLLLLMYLVLVFSTESELGQQFLGLAQTLVAFAVGLHYYMTVFHRVVLRQPPKTNWKIHGIYATCFLVICVFAGAERRKKAYLVEGTEEAKTS